MAVAAMAAFVKTTVPLIAVFEKSVASQMMAFEKRAMCLMVLSVQRMALLQEFLLAECPSQSCSHTLFLSGPHCDLFEHCKIWILAQKEHSCCGCNIHRR
jgi:hypothetical protein